MLFTIGSLSSMTRTATYAAIGSPASSRVPLSFWRVTVPVASS